MMTLDEAIRHAERVVTFCEVKASGRDPHSPKFESNIVRNLMKCAEEHKQLVKWLKELKQLKEQEPTTKDNLAVDCISRAQIQAEIQMHASRYTIAKERGGMGHVEWSDQLIKVSDAINIIRNLPSATPQEHLLDKIREEIESKYENCCCENWSIGTVVDILEIIDKHKAKSE